MERFSGIFPKLKSATLPWEEKLELARNGWHSADCVIPNKPQVLLDWLCQELINAHRRNARDSLEHDMILQLWTFLGEALSSAEVKGHSGPPLSIKPQLLQTFVEAFSHSKANLAKCGNRLLEISVRCCLILMDTPGLGDAFFSKFETFVPFLSSLLSLFISSNLENQNQEVLSLVHKSLEKFLVLQRRLANQRKVFSSTCQHLLQLFLSLRYMLKVSKHQTPGLLSAENACPIVDMVHSALIGAFFHRDHLTEFHAALKVLKNEGAKHASYPKQLFDTLRQPLKGDRGHLTEEGSNTADSVRDGLPFLLNGFIDSNRDNSLASPAVEFDFFTEFCDMLGVNDGLIKYDITKSGKLLSLLHEMLLSILNQDIYQAADDGLNGSIQFNWFVKQAQLLLKVELSPATFNCLAVLLRLNQLIVEPFLEDVCGLFWDFKGEQQRRATSMIMSDALEASKDSLMAAITSTYFKLGQFDKLLMSMFSSLRREQRTCCRRIPPQFLEGYIEVAKRVPFGQSAVIWQIFCDEIKQNYLQTAKSSPSEENQEACGLDAALCGSLEHVAVLFSVFLLNTSLGSAADHRKTKATLDAICRLHDQTVTEVLVPLTGAAPRLESSKSQRSVCFSALVLHHAVGEFTTFLESCGLLRENQGAPEFKWIEALACHVPADSWNTLTILRKDKGKLKFVQDLLCVQRIRHRLRKATAEPLGHDGDYWAAVSRLCRFPEYPEKFPNALWDGQVWSVDRTNYAAAHWDLLARHSPVIVPLCSSEQRTSLSRFLISSLVNGPLEKPEGDNRLLSVAGISLRLLHTAAFHENVSMQTSLVCAFWQEVQRTLNSELESQASLAQVFATVASRDDTEDELLGHDGNENEDEAGKSDDASDSDSEDGIGQDRLRSGHQLPDRLVAAGRILGGIFDGRTPGPPKRDVLTGASVQAIHRLCEVLGRLPNEWFTDDNHVRTFLGMLACHVLLLIQTSKGISEELIQASLSCQRLLRLTLEGCVESGRLVLHHVANLAAFQTWLLSSVGDILEQQQQQSEHIPDAVESGCERLLSCSSELLCSVQKFLLRASPHNSNTSDILVDKLCENPRLVCSQLEEQGRAALQSLLKTQRAVLTVMTGLVATYEQMIGSKTSRDRVVRGCVRHVLQLAPPFLELLQAIYDRTKTRKRKHRQEGESPAANLWRDALWQTPQLIEAFASLIQICRCVENSRKLSFAVGGVRDLSWRAVFPAVLAGVIRLFQDGMRKVEKEQTDATQVHALMSVLRFLGVVCRSCSLLTLDLPDNFHPRMLASLLRLLQVSGDNAPTNIKQLTGEGSTLHSAKETADSSPQQTPATTSRISEVMMCLFQGCSKDALLPLLQALCEELNLKDTLSGSLPRPFAALRVWCLLLSGPFVKERRTELRPVLNTLLLSLQSLLQKLLHSAPAHCVVVMDTMQKVLFLGKAMLTPQYATLVLHACVLTGVRSPSESFLAMFHSQASVLSTLLFQHAEAVYRAVHVFITCLKNLLRSIFSCCKTNAENSVERSGETEEPGFTGETVLLTCAQKLSRLYQEVGTHKVAFSKYSPYMIAEYITGVQEVFLPAAVKESLKPGLYCLLDLCGEYEVALLHAVLEKGARELMRALHEDYTKFHKFKGKV